MQDLSSIVELLSSSRLIKKTKKMDAIVNASSEAMTQIINTVSSSIVALDSNKKMNINNGICSS